MAMPASVRRAALAMHVISSVGWIGAAAAYLVLGITAALSQSPLTVRAAWIGMELLGWQAVVPLGCLALVTGLIMSVGTPWGLVRHYWVLIALALTVLALAVLVFHMPAVTAGADLARTLDDRAVTELGGDVLHPALGLVVLIVIAVLNIIKPRGMTRYGQKRAQERAARSAVRASRVVRGVGIDRHLMVNSPARMAATRMLRRVLSG
jgi:hypothetical protein